MVSFITFHPNAPILFNWDPALTGLITGPNYESIKAFMTLYPSIELLNDNLHVKGLTDPMEVCKYVLWTLGRGNQITIKEPGGLENSYSTLYKIHDGSNGTKKAN